MSHYQLARCSVWAGLSALSLCACLSVDRISQHPDLPAIPYTPEDSGTIDLDAAWSPDGGAQVDASADAGIPCQDRGTYRIEGVEVEGMLSACSDDLTCVAGQCVPVPPCAQGVVTECLFTPENTLGAPLDFAMHGDHVYWVEPGTMNQFGRYRDDGAIARAKVGVWAREQVVNSLDFYNEDLLRLEQPLSLRVNAKYISVTMAKRSVTVAFAGGRLTSYTHDSGGWPECFSSHGCYTLGENGPAEVNLYTGETDGILGGGWLPEGGHCALATGSGDIYWSYDDGSVLRLELLGSEPDLVANPPQEWLGVSADNKLVGMRLNWLVTAPSRDNPLRWTQHAGGMGYLGGTAILRDDGSETPANENVVWAHAGATRADSVVLKASLAARNKLQVVAEIPELVDTQVESFRLIGAKSHVMWRVGSSPVLHYAPAR